MSTWWIGNQTLLLTLFVTYILGLSIQVVLKSGTFSLASAGTWLVSAYLSAQLALHDYPWLEGTAVAVAASILISAVLAVLFARLSGLFLGMATIAFDLLVVAVAFAWEWATGGSLGLYGIPREPTVLGVLLVAVLATVVVEALQIGAGGRATNLVREDTIVAQSVGINVGALRRQAFILSGALGGLAGAISPLIFGVLNPNSGGFSLVVTGLSVVVLGGMRSWVGVAVGAVLVTWLPQWLSFMETWRDAVYGVLVVVMVIFAPRGLADVVRRLARSGMRQFRKRKASIRPETAVAHRPEEQSRTPRRRRLRRWVG